MFFSSLRAAALAAAALPALASAQALTLEAAMDRAVQRSEAARSARAGMSSASQAAQAAGQLPDPTLAVGIENLPATGPDQWSTTREAMTMKRLALSQEWVSAEKRRLRTTAADAMVARELTAVAAATAEARLQTALAYLDAYYAAENFRLSSATEMHAHEALEAARARLAAGSANAQDVLGLSMTQGTALDEAAEARQQAASASVNLQRWTGMAADQLSPPAMPAAPSEQVYIDAHPAVAARRRDIDVARGEAAVTASNRRPNWTMEVAYGQRTGYSDLVSVLVNIPLPVAPASRQDRDTAAKLALAEKAEAELLEATRGAQAEYRMLASDMQRLSQRIKSYEVAVLEPALQRTAAATAAYGANQASLAMVFDARHGELEVRRKLLNMQRELAKVRAQLSFKPLKLEEPQ